MFGRRFLLISMELVCLSAIWVVMSLMGCGDSTNRLSDGHEIAAQMAPDGLSRAFVWVPKMGSVLGATLSQPYEVWLEGQKGEMVRGMKGQQGEMVRRMIFQAIRTDGVRLAWRAPRELEICYESGTDIGYFNNFFVVAEEHSPQIYEVEITLRKVQKLSDCP